MKGQRKPKATRRHAILLGRTVDEYALVHVRAPTRDAALAICCDAIDQAVRGGDAERLCDLINAGTWRPGEDREYRILR